VLEVPVSRLRVEVDPQAPESFLPLLEDCAIGHDDAHAPYQVRLEELPEHRGGEKSLACAGGGVQGSEPVRPKSVQNDRKSLLLPQSELQALHVLGVPTP
jgi:hypothetical protein